MAETDTEGQSSKTPNERIGVYKGWHREAKEASVEWRKDSSEDGRFYHGGKGQWKPEDITTLEAEGRPVFSINRIKPTIDLQKGIEIKSRTDISARPRGKNDGGTADAITSGFKYIQDQNNADHKLSDVFFDGLKAGIGWVEICENDDPREEEILLDRIDWKYVGWDPLARSLLFDDSRFMFKEKWIDLEVAKKKWPAKADELETALQDTKGEGSDSQHVQVKPDQYASGKSVQYHDTARKRILTVQMYFKKPTDAVFLKLKDGTVKEIAPDVLAANPAIIASPLVIRVIKTPVDKIWVSIFSGDTVLEEEALMKAKHDRYPLIPYICYLDEDENPYGMIRNMKDQQREINKNRSQYSHIITTRRVFFETGALKDPIGAKSQISRPDAWIELTHGSLNMKKFQFQQDTAVAAEHFKIMQEAKQEIQEVSGAVEEQMGMQTNARSGVAIEARQRQGATVNTEPFDNLRLMKRRMGEIMLSEMRRLWTYEKVIRITDEQTGADKFVTFNQGGANNITQGRYDIVVSDHPETDTTRNWMSRTLADFATRMPPDVALPIMQVSLEMTDIPNKEKVMAKLAEAIAKQDELTQQKLLADHINKQKPPAAPAKEEPKPMGPAEPGLTPEEAIDKIIAGETWGAVTTLKDSTVEKAAEFKLAPKPPAGGDTPAAPVQA